jgi:hypothetical protein
VPTTTLHCNKLGLETSSFVRRPIQYLLRPKKLPSFEHTTLVVI